MNLFGAKTDTPVLACRKIASERDWRELSERIEALGGGTWLLPWNQPDYWRACHELAFPEAELWAIDISNAVRPLAVGVFRMENDRRRWGTLRVLRALDWSAMCIAPLTCREDDRELVADALLGLRGELHAKTGADLMAWYQLDANAAQALIAALNAERECIDVLTLSERQIIEPDQIRNMKKKRHNAKRLERRMNEEIGQAAIFSRMRGDILPELRERGIWAEIEALYRSSWQAAFVRDQGRADPEQGIAYLNRMAKAWSARGWLDVALYRVGERLAAAYVNLAINGGVWLLYTFYDADYESYGVGANNLTHMIEDSLKRADRFLDFGGEAVDWKKRWSTNESAILKLEMPLAGAKARVWRTMRRARQRLKPYGAPVLHAIQNRRQAEGLTGETVATRTEIRLLKNEADWQDAKAIHDGLNATPITPWSGFAHAHTFARHFGESHICWQVVIREAEGDTPLACGLFMESEIRKGPLTLKALRSLDQMSMGHTPFVLGEAGERLPADTLAEAAIQACNAAKADLLTLYRQNAEQAQPLARALSGKGFTTETRVFTRASLIEFGNDFDSYLANRNSHLLRNLEKARRRIEREWGAPLAIELAPGNPEHPDFVRLFGAFERLRAASWQVARTKNRRLADTDAVAAYYRDMAAYWARAGILQLSLLSIDGAPAATYLSVGRAPGMYAVLTAFDHNLARFSPGRLAFVEMLRLAHAAGCRRMDIGGEGGDDWKADWRTSERDLLQITAAMPTIKGSVWSALKRVKGMKGEPVR